MKIAAIFGRKNNLQSEIDAMNKEHFAEIEKIRLNYENDLKENLRTNTENYRKKILGVLCKTDCELREISKFPIYKNDESNKWDMITGICSLGGCEYKWIEFDTEREALINSVIRKMFGDTVDLSSACQKCYTEYIKDCI